MDDRGQDAISTIRAKLTERIGADQAVWFDKVDFVPSNGMLTVVGPDKFMLDWLRSRFVRDLEAVTADLFGQPLMIQFQQRSSDVSQPTSSMSSNKEVEQCETTPNSSPAVTPIARTTPQPKAVRVTKPRGGSLEDFIVGDSNRLGFSATQMAATQAGRMSPLFIHGPTGVGKTHLLEAACLAQRQSGGKAVYLTAEQFTCEFVEAVKGGGIPLFRRKYRDVTLLALDDLPFFARKKATIAELVHTMDSVSRRGGQVVLGSDWELPRLKELGVDLVSRISGGVVCAIGAPEFGTRLGIVRQMSRKLEVELDEEVAQYIAGHIVGNARLLAGAVKRLAAMSVAMEERIDRDLAEQALEDLMSVAAQPVKLEDIQHVVCEEFGLEPSSLQSTRRDLAVNHARMLAMWLARNHTRAALSEIGRFFGGRSHSAVVAAQKRVSTMLSRGGQVHYQGRPRSLDSSIRQLQCRLKLA